MFYNQRLNGEKRRFLLSQKPAVFIKVGFVHQLQDSARNLGVLLGKTKTVD